MATDRDNSTTGRSIMMRPDGQSGRMIPLKKKKKRISRRQVAIVNYTVRLGGIILWEINIHRIFLGLVLRRGDIIGETKSKNRTDPFQFKIRRSFGFKRFNFRITIKNSIKPVPSRPNRNRRRQSFSTESLSRFLI